MESSSDIDDKIHFINSWVKIFLGDDDTKNEKKKRPQDEYIIAFGRTTHPNILKKSSINPESSRILSSCLQPIPQKYESVSNKVATTTGASTSVSGHDAKMKGRQIMISKQNLEQAKEKRTRQMKYALDVKNSRKTIVALHISSITRIVVQNFRNLINCERCALFLMDHSTNELCFKPDGGMEKDPREIRFSATSGVAGWVASNRQTLNIPNAYQDPRFNPNIDIQTNFRTRNILCMPVISSNGLVFGVIQMVNKKKGDSKIIQNNAKKKKSDSTHHGYESCFEPFSTTDEELLGKCCFQVSKALENIVQGKLSTMSDVDNDDKDSVSLNSTNEELKKRKNSSVSVEEAVLRRERRRSSVGNLVQFVNAETAKSNQDHKKKKEGLFGKDSSVSEATTRFQFRTFVGPQISARGSLQNDTEHMIAATKRKRMVDYYNQRRITEKIKFDIK